MLEKQLKFSMGAIKTVKDEDKAQGGVVAIQLPTISVTTCDHQHFFDMKHY
jgi:hypothetical protein